MLGVMVLDCRLAVQTHDSATTNTARDELVTALARPLAKIILNNVRMVGVPEQDNAFRLEVVHLHPASVCQASLSLTIHTTVPELFRAAEQIIRGIKSALVGQVG